MVMVSVNLILKERLIITMGISTMANGWMVIKMVKEFIHLRMVIFIQESGRMGSIMGKVKLKNKE